MKYVKMLGLLVVVAAAQMAFASAALATTLTSPAGTTVGVGTVIKAESEGSIKFDGTVVLTCQKSIIEGKITNAGGESSTVSGSISALTFTECGNNTVTVTNLGSLEFHKNGTNTATITSSGPHITALTHNILGTVHCIYGLNNTDIATLTGSGHSGNTTATLHINSPIPETPTDTFACKDDVMWTGTYPIPTPDHLIVD